MQKTTCKTDIPEWLDDQERLEILYHRNFKLVSHYVLRNNGSIEQAEDVYQEAFVTTWQKVKLGKFSPNTTSDWNAYLFKVAKFKWIDFLRTKEYKLKKELKEEMGYLSDEMKTNAEEGSDEKYIDKIMQQMKEMKGDCQKILHWFYFKKWSMREIGVRLGISEASAKNGKYRCIKELRSRVKKETSEII